MIDLESKIAIVKHKRQKAIASKTKSLAHRFNLEINPPIALEELISIENQYKIKLPAEYRAFISNIANGSFGPGRFLSLQDSLMYRGHVKQQNQLKNNFLAIPFTHTTAYNPDEDPYFLELGKRCDQGAISETKYEKAWDYSTAGSMTISVGGCGYCCFLVITGPTRGQIWFDGEVSDQGYIPANLSFIDWYEKWLDENFHH